MRATTRSEFNRLSARGLPRGLLLAAFVMTMALAGFLRAAAPAVPLDAAITSAFAGHKLTWICLAIAAWHLLQSQRNRLRTAELLAIVPAAALIMSSWQSWPWLGLAMSLSLLIFAADKTDSSARVGLSIALAVSLHQGLVPMLAQLAGDDLLALDAQIAALLAGLFVSDLSLQGTTLGSASGHSVVLVWGCSSLSQIGEAMLFCWSLCSLSPHANAQPRKVLVCVTLVMALTISLNTLRLALLASSPSLFDVIHDGSGATAFRLLTLGTVLMVALGYHRSCLSAR